MELSELLLALRRYWFISLIGIVGFTFIGSAAAFGPPDQYSGTAVLLAQPTTGATDYGSIQAVQFLLPGLAEQAEGRSLVQGARGRLSSSLASVDGSFSAVAEPDGGILRISVTSQSQAFVAPAANALADEIVKQNAAAELLQLSVLDRARRPIAPSGPARIPVFAGSLVLGLIAGVFGAVGADAMRRRLDGANEIRTRFGTTILGEVPPFPRLRGRPATMSSLFNSNRFPGVVESFHQLRANLEIVLTTRDITAIAITSSQVGEGKTTICASLGWALALVGHDVTLIDCDLRRPSLHKLLGQSGERGVASAVTAEPGSLTRPTSQSSLRFVPAGVPDRHPAEVVSIALPRLLESLEGVSKLVIVDSPPLGGAAETSLIAALTKHVILVVDARRNHLEDIERSLAQLHQAGAEVLGVVVNRARIRGHRKTSQQYYYVQTPGRKARPSAPAPSKGGASAPTPAPSKSGDGSVAKRPVTGPSR